MVVAGIWLGWTAAAVGAATKQPTAEQVQFFEARIRPLLAGQCSWLSRAGKAEVEPALDSAEGLRKGGASGEACWRPVSRRRAC